ncbi:hypothetical protein, partial [Klebsiella pneumoniae]|uniref:hypothetical protein n=1 Tax=Klebsiella pneumoniae TaxID=573 RepID=UPI0039F0043F
MTPGCTAIPGGAVPTRSTTIPGHIGQPAKPQRHIPNQTQPAVFWRAFACALAGCTAKVRARQAAFGEVCRPLPYPQSAQAKARQNTARLRAKPTSYCALCADRPGPASAGA